MTVPRDANTDYSIPADTIRNNDVVIASKRRHFDVLRQNDVFLTQ